METDCYNPFEYPKISGELLRTNRDGKTFLRYEKVPSTISEQKYSVRYYVDNFIDPQLLWEKIQSLGIILKIDTQRDYMMGGTYVDVLFLKKEVEPNTTLSEKVFTDTMKSLNKEMAQCVSVNNPSIEIADNPKLPVKTYEQYYWDYVNSDDAVSATENLSGMLSKVTENQQPAPGMKSWVAEPEQEQIIHQHSYDNRINLIKIVLLCTIPLIIATNGHILTLLLSVLFGN